VLQQGGCRSAPIQCGSRTQQLQCCSREGVDQPRYSVVLAPSNSNLFGPLCSMWLASALQQMLRRSVTLWLWTLDTDVLSIPSYKPWCYGGGWSAGADVQMSVMTTWHMVCTMCHVYFKVNNSLASDCLLALLFKRHPVCSVCFSYPVSLH